MTAVVRLEGLPCRLFSAAEEQWSAMLREYTLRGLGGSAQSYGADEITRAGACLGLVSDAVHGLGPEAESFSGELAVANPGDFALLQGILDEVLQLQRHADLLVLAPLQEVVDLREWLCGQVAEQSAGAAPRPWQLQTEVRAPRDTDPPEWDRSLVPGDDVSWLVGDDHNRLVAASPTALAMLGWTEDDLIGQRLLAVIPHRLREAHIAGFTRSAVTGGGDLLGQPLELPALTRDGRELPITLTLSRHEAKAGRHVYLAVLNPSS